MPKFHLQIKKGFDGVDKRFADFTEHVDKRFEEVNEHFEWIEKLILADHKRRIEGRVPLVVEKKDGACFR